MESGGSKLSRARYKVTYTQVGATCAFNQDEINLKGNHNDAEGMRESVEKKAQIKALTVEARNINVDSWKNIKQRLKLTLL